MVGMAEMMGAVQGLKTGLGLLQSLNAAAKEAAINDVKIVLGQHILNAQGALMEAGAAQSESAEKIRQLEQEIVRLKDWSADKERYELKRYWPGSLAYTLKPSMAGTDPPHHLCANCYEGGQKSILQPTERVVNRYRIHRCNSCKAEMQIGAEMEQPSGPPGPEPDPEPPTIGRREGSWTSARRG